MARRTIVQEFEGASLGDARLNRRLVALGDQMFDDPAASFPDALEEAELEGAYRFFGNRSVTMAGIMAPHVRETLARVKRDEVTLALHDTTTLSFRAEGKRVGFSEFASTNTQQFWAHTTLAVAGDGRREPYGVLHVSTDTKIAHERWREHVDHCEELGIKGAVVHVMDREADDYALFAALRGRGAKFVIRLQYDRSLKIHRSDAPRYLSDTLLQPKIYAEREVTLGARFTPSGSKQRRVHPARAGRVAHLAIASCEVRLPRPSDRSGDLPPWLDLNVVRVWEPNPPVGEAPVEWMLITSEPTSTVAEMLRVVDWYRARWTIEEFFKALKTGCSIEKRQLESFTALSKAVAFFAPIAWHLLLIRYEARHSPDRPASDVLNPHQMQALRVLSRRALPEIPTARDISLAIAALGGHLKRNGEPGWITLARGYEKLRLVAVGLAAPRYDQS